MSANSEYQLIASTLSQGLTPDLADALGLLTPDMFTVDVCRQAFAVMQELQRQEIPVDTFSVVERLDNHLATQLLDLTQSSATTSQPMAHAKVVARAYQRSTVSRRLGEMSHAMANGAIELTELYRELSTIAGQLDSAMDYKPAVRLGDLAEGFLDIMDARLAGSAEHRGLDIGLGCLINRTDLVIIGGTPGMGKTSLLMFILWYLATNGKTSLVFSLEMENMQIFEREMSRLTGLSTTQLKDPTRIPEHRFDESFARLGPAVQQSKELPIYIDDMPNLTMESLSYRARQHLNQHPDTAAIAVDYLTLMKMPDGKERHLQIGEITRRCKLLAKELKVPIFMLSQMNRDAARHKREPEIADLRESGSIEQDADKVFFPYREEVYFPDSPNAGVAKVLKRKVRDGEPGEVLLRFDQGNFKLSAEPLSWRARGDADDGDFRG